MLVDDGNIDNLQMTEKNLGFPQDPGGWHYQGSADIPSATYTQSPPAGVSSAKLTVYRPSRGTMEGYYHEGAYATPSALEGKMASP